MTVGKFTYYHWEKVVLFNWKNGASKKQIIARKQKSWQNINTCPILEKKGIWTSQYCCALF